MQHSISIGPLLPLQQAAWTHPGKLGRKTSLRYCSHKACLLRHHRLLPHTLPALFNPTPTTKDLPSEMWCIRWHFVEFSVASQYGSGSLNPSNVRGINSIDIHLILVVHLRHLSYAEIKAGGRTRSLSLSLSLSRPGWKTKTEPIA